LPLFIDESTVEQLLPMQEAIRLLHEGFSSLGIASLNLSRASMGGQRRALRLAGGYDVLSDRFGLKASLTGINSGGVVVVLWDRQTGAIEAIIEGDLLGQIRTGAASGVATDLLASVGAERLAVIGSGPQARTQIQAVAAVRHLSEIRVFARHRARLEAFCRTLGNETGIPVSPASSVDEAVVDAQVICTATTAEEPFLYAKHLAPGAHVNAVGSNWPTRAELSADAVACFDLIACDSVEQAQAEAGDLIRAAAVGGFDWSETHELSDVARSGFTRTADSITLFKSVGLGVEDVVVGSYVAAQARTHGVGINSPDFWTSG
jgi:alanine dehydrogenase